MRGYLEGAKSGSPLHLIFVYLPPGPLARSVRNRLEWLNTDQALEGVSNSLVTQRTEMDTVDMVLNNRRNRLNIRARVRESAISQIVKTHGSEPQVQTC